MEQDVKKKLNVTEWLLLSIYGVLSFCNKSSKLKRIYNKTNLKILYLKWIQF